MVVESSKILKRKTKKGKTNKKVQKEIKTKPGSPTKSKSTQKRSNLTTLIEDATTPAYLHKVGGFNLLHRRPVLSNDSKLLYIACGRTVRVYSTSNGSFVNEYNFENSTATIVSVQPNPTDSDHLVVALSDGAIINWNVVDNVKQSQAYLSFNSNCSKLIYFRQVGGTYYFIINKIQEKGNKKSTCRLYYCDQHSLDNVWTAKQEHVLNPQVDDRSLAFGPGNKPEFIATFHKSFLYIYEIRDRSSSCLKSRTHMITENINFTCVAFHPLDAVVATGDSLGRIMLWHNITSANPFKSVLTWHAQAVGDLAYSPSGSHLYSGGEEKVLVKWNLVGVHSGEKSFLPRLGSPIKYVLVDHDHKMVVTSHQDQGLMVRLGFDSFFFAYSSNFQIIDTQLNGVRTVIEGLAASSSDKLTSGLNYMASLGSLALNGRVGHVQLYNPERQKQLFQLDVTEQNVVSKISRAQSFQDRIKLEKEKAEDAMNKIFPVEVSLVATCPSTNWMATVEYRDDGENMPEIRLKFWLLKEVYEPSQS